MKKLAILAAAVMAIMIVDGCKPSAKKTDEGRADAEAPSIVNQEEPDSTVYGTFVDGGNSAMEIKCDDDTVRDFIIAMDNDSNIVYGGKTQGDQMALTYYTNEMGERIATKVINLTTLQATWVSLDKNFEILKGGTVKSHQEGETRPWTTWRIINGHLLLDKDTFDIDRLDGDSLFLENKQGIFAYSRGKGEGLSKKVNNK